MKNGAREIALWAGCSAFFGVLVGLKLLELVSHSDWLQIVAGLFLAFVVAGAAYSRERLAAARSRENK